MSAQSEAKRHPEVITSDVTLTVPVCRNCGEPVFPVQEMGDYRGATCHRVCALELWVEELRPDEEEEEPAVLAYTLSAHQRRLH